MNDLRASLRAAIRKPYLADGWLMAHGERLIAENERLTAERAEDRGRCEALMRFAERVERVVENGLCGTSTTHELFNEIRAALDELNNAEEP